MIMADSWSCRERAESSIMASADTNFDGAGLIFTARSSRSSLVRHMFGRKLYVSGDINTILLYNVPPPSYKPAHTLSYPIMSPWLPASTTSHPAGSSCPGNPASIYPGSSIISNNWLNWLLIEIYSGWFHEQLS